MSLKCNDVKCSPKYELIRNMHTFKCLHCGFSLFRADSEYSEESPTKRLQEDWIKAMDIRIDENNQKTVQRIRRY